MKALLTQQKQTGRSRLPLSQRIPGWVQVALLGWMAFCPPLIPPIQSSYDPGVEYVAVGTARIDYSKSSPEQCDGRAERARASQFLELVTTINGVRSWHVTGPDLDGRYGGLNGCGGVEAIYNQSTSSAIYLLSDTYGHTEGTFNGTTFTWNPTQCDGYGALPGTTKPSALIAGANVASQLGWRGHYIDPTGFYYMGARNYAPDSGTFLSPDPLGHSANMDLYSYCNGDPINNFDPDGRMILPFMAPIILQPQALKEAAYAAPIAIMAGSYLAGPEVGVPVTMAGVRLMGIGGIIGASANVIGTTAGSLMANQSLPSGRDLGASAIGGFTSGVATVATQNPVFGGTVNGYVTTALTTTFNGQPYDPSRELLNTVVGGGFGAIQPSLANTGTSLFSINGINSGGNSLLAIANQIETKTINQTIRDISWQTTAKSLAGQAVAASYSDVILNTGSSLIDNGYGTFAPASPELQGTGSHIEQDPAGKFTKN